MTRTHDKEHGRTEILSAAAAAIAARGYHGMSMRELAKATHKALATFYHYFPSKEEVLFALQQEAFEALIADAEALLGAAGAPPTAQRASRTAVSVRPFGTLRAGSERVEGRTEAASHRAAAARLHAFILNHVRAFLARPDVMRVLIHEAGALPPARRRRIRALKERYFALGRAVIAPLAGAGADAADVERAAYCVFGMLNWVYGWYDAARHGTAEDVAGTIHRLALGGLGRPRAHTTNRHDR